MTLSDQINTVMTDQGTALSEMLDVKDVKQFVRELDEFCDLMRDGTRDAVMQSKILQIQLKIEELAGDRFA